MPRKQSNQGRRARPQHRCSTRVIPYYLDSNNNIILMLFTAWGYGDWTSIGGKCHEIDGGCPSDKDPRLLKCALRELEEESHFLITPNDIELTRCATFNYTDDRGIHNNLRFTQLKKDPRVIVTAFDDPKLIAYLQSLPNYKDYLETEKIGLFPLKGQFLTYASNTFTQQGSIAERIDDSVFKGLMSAVRVRNPSQLVDAIERTIRSCS